MSRNRRGASIVAVAIVLAAFLRSAAAEDAAAGGAGPAVPEIGSMLLFPAVILGGPANGETEALGTALTDATEKALSARAFRVTYSAEPLAEGEGQAAEASSRALSAGARWAAIASLELADKRIAYSVRVFDASEAGLVASAGFSAYAGLSALPLMADSAAAVATKAAAYRDSTTDTLVAPVQYRIRVSSPDEGASVRIGDTGSSGSRELGTIKNGTLDFPYIPFHKGAKIVVSISAKDRIPLDIPITLGEDAPDIVAPALQKQDKKDLLLGTGPGRLLGLGITYRLYLIPGWDFLFFNERLFAGYDFSPTSIPVVHLETWEGIGSYLLFPPQSRFRLGADIGWGILLSFTSASSSSFSASVFADIALIPMEAFLEYRLKSDVSVWVSARGEFSVSASGLLGWGWVGNGQPDLSVGLLWRR